jgi:TonB family protein
MKRVALFAIIAVAGLTASAQSPTEVKNLNAARAYYAQSDAVYPYVDSAPAFPGGAEKWNAYVLGSPVLTSAIEKAKQENMPAGIYQVTVRFTVGQNGTIADAKTVGKPYGYGLEEAAIRLVKESGKWTPANIEGENSKGTLQLPIRFAIVR